MNTDNENTETKKCPFCAEQIKQEAIKCKHCGGFFVAEKAPSEMKTGDREAAIQGKSNSMLIALLLGAVFLHVLFCAESPLIFISLSNPGLSIAGSIGYSIPGMIISIIFLAPIASYFIADNIKKGFFKGFTLKSITMALYCGAAVRLVLFLSKFKV